MGLKGKDKEASRLRSQQLWPSADLRKKKDHGRAEALLLAWYGYMHIYDAATSTNKARNKIQVFRPCYFQPWYNTPRNTPPLIYRKLG